MHSSYASSRFSRLFCSSLQNSHNQNAKQCKIVMFNSINSTFCLKTKHYQVQGLGCRYIHMSALKLEELYRMLTLSAVEEEIYMNCWQRTQNPEVGSNEINWLSNILMNEPMFNAYSKETKQELFEKTLKAYNQISFIDNRGKPLNPYIGLFLCLDLTSAIENPEDFINEKLSSVVVYNSEDIRKLDKEGGLLFSRGTQVFIDFLHYSIHLIKYYDELFSQSFENPLKDMQPKVSIDNINDIPKADLNHLKKYIKNAKERVKQVKDKRNKVDKILAWTEKLSLKPQLNKATKMQLLSLISSLNAELSQEEVKHPKSLFLSKEELTEFENLSLKEGVITAFSNIPYSGLTKEIVDCINSCKSDAEYSVHISLPRYLKDISIENSNVFIHEISHLIDQELKETHSGVFNWASKLESMKQEGVDNHLSDYALKDKKELFSVCVEHYTQDPKKFEDKHPSIFLKLKELIHSNSCSRNKISDLTSEFIKKSYLS